MVDAIEAGLIAGLPASSGELVSYRLPAIRATAIKFAKLYKLDFQDAAAMANLKMLEATPRYAAAVGSYRNFINAVVGNLLRDVREEQAKIQANEGEYLAGGDCEDCRLPVIGQLEDRDRLAVAAGRLTGVYRQAVDGMLADGVPLVKDRTAVQRRALVMLRWALEGQEGV